MERFAARLRSGAGVKGVESSESGIPRPDSLRFSRGDERRPRRASMSIVTGASDAGNAQSVGASLRPARSAGQVSLRVLSVAREAKSCPREVRSARACEAVREERVERVAARAVLTELIRERVSASLSA